MLDRCEADSLHGDEPYLPEPPALDPDLLPKRELAEDCIASYDLYQARSFFREVCLMRELIRSGRPIDEERYAEFTVGVLDRFDTLVRMLSAFEASFRHLDITGTQLDPAEVLRAYEGQI